MVKDLPLRHGRVVERNPLQWEDMPLSKTAHWACSKELLEEVEFRYPLGMNLTEIYKYVLRILFLLKEHFDNILNFPHSLQRNFLHVFSHLIAFQLSPLGSDDLIIGGYLVSKTTRKFTTGRAERKIECFVKVLNFCHD